MSEMQRHQKRETVSQPEPTLEVSPSTHKCSVWAASYQLSQDSFFYHPEGQLLPTISRIQASTQLRESKFYLKVPQIVLRTQPFSRDRWLPSALSTAPLSGNIDQKAYSRSLQQSDKTNRQRMKEQLTFCTKCEPEQTSRLFKNRTQDEFPNILT